jgi:hypothetical protein
VVHNIQVFAFTKFLWGVYRGKRMTARAEQLYQQVIIIIP